METIYCERIQELKRTKKHLERKLNANISIQGRKVTIEADPLGEYEASLIIEAINLGFPMHTAILLEDENYNLKIINIKDCTRRRDLNVIKSRLIGTRGKTKNTIEQISGCQIRLKDNSVGIIGPAENIENAVTGITNLIRGTKQANIYRYLEKINTRKKTFKE